MSVVFKNTSRDTKAAAESAPSASETIDSLRALINSIGGLFG